jgi:protein TonB
MQYTGAITRQPIIIGLLLSIALHGAMLHNRAIWAPPVPHLETGRTAIQLTLLPSPSGNATASPAKQTTVQPVPAQNDEPARQLAPARESAASQYSEPSAQTEEQKGITSPAAASGAFHPTYPRTARQRGEEGTVTLRVQVLPDGTAGAIEVLQSSGYGRLDRAAVKAAGKTEYDPALLLGQTVESMIELSYTYRLTSD